MNVGNEFICNILLYAYILFIIVYLVVSIRNLIVSPEFKAVLKNLKKRK